MTATAPPATVTPQPVDLYEAANGDIYLRRGDYAYLVHADWPARLKAAPCPFRVDAEHWGTLTGPGTEAARQLALKLDNRRSAYLRIATFDGNRVELHRRFISPGTRAYLGDAYPDSPPPPSPVAATIPAPRAKPSPAPKPNPYDAVPPSVEREPEVEVRLSLDIVLGLHRDTQMRNHWHLLVCDSAGRFLSRWGSGMGECPAAVWQLAAEAASRHHFIRSGRH